MLDKNHKPKFKALYGSFNLDMSPNITTDVTNQVSQFVNDNVLHIKKDIKFDELFGNSDQEKRKYLQITSENRIFNILKDNYIDDHVIHFAPQKNKIKIVYYVYTNPKANWRTIISGQLIQLMSYGILSEADLYIHITDCFNCLDEFIYLIKKITPNAIISSSLVNEFEYPGLKLVHGLALENPEDTIIYFHSKGMSYNLHSRNVNEITLFTKTFENWRRTIQYLSKDGMNKAGLFFEKRGWVWYNYWYAKASFLSECIPPYVTSNRYHYEAWIGVDAKNKFTNNQDCVFILEQDNFYAKSISSTGANAKLNTMSIKSIRDQPINKILYSEFYSIIKRIFRK
jgi:hypothetical protein